MLAVVTPALQWRWRSLRRTPNLAYREVSPSTGPVMYLSRISEIARYDE